MLFLGGKDGVGLTARAARLARSTAGRTPAREPIGVGGPRQTRRSIDAVLTAFRNACLVGGCLVLLGLVSSADAAQLKLDWTDNSHNEKGFRILRKNGTEGAFTEIATRNSNATSYVDTTVSAGTTYCYHVQAYNDAGDSAPSNEACAVAGTPVTHAVTVAKTGAGSGTVASSPVGIDCGSDCGENYAGGTSVALSATPASGSTFAGWSGACTGTGSCTVIVNAAKSITAAFAAGGPITYTLTVRKAGSGTGTVTANPSGIACGTDCTEPYVANTAVTLTATPASGSTFTGWSGACTGTGSICTVGMTTARTVTTTFAAVTGSPPMVSLTASPNGAQSVGTPITATATASGVANPTYRFWLWDGTAWRMLRDWGNSATYTWTASTGGPYQLGVWVKSGNTAEDVGAAYAAAPITITPPTLSLAASPNGTYRVGTSITFTATASGVANPMYRFWRWGGTAWTLVRDWNSSATYRWRPRAANPGYEVGVWVKDASTAGDVAAAFKALPVPVQ